MNSADKTESFEKYNLKISSDEEFEKIKAAFYNNPCDRDWGDTLMLFENVHESNDPFCLNICELEERTKAISEDYGHKSWVLEKLTEYPMVRCFTA